MTNRYALITETMQSLVGTDFIEFCTISQNQYLQNFSSPIYSRKKYTRNENFENVFLLLTEPS